MFFRKTAILKHFPGGGAMHYPICEHTGRVWQARGGVAVGAWSLQGPLG